MPNPRKNPAGQLSLFGDDDQPLEPAAIIDNSNMDDLRPLPLIVADKWNFRLQYHIIDGVYWFSLHDWVKGVVGGNSPQTMIANLTRSMVESETLFSKQPLDYKASDGKIYQRDYVTDKNLYTFSQQMRAMKKHPLVAIIKQYLADAGAFTDLTRRKPEAVGRAVLSYSDQRKRKELAAQGWSEDEIQQWLDVRSVERASNIRIGAAWKRGGVTERKDYAMLNNTVSRVATGETATQHKITLQTDAPRDGLSALENAAIHVVQAVAELLHTTRHSHGMTELVSDIRDTNKIINRGELEAQFGKRRPRLTDGGK